MTEYDDIYDALKAIVGALGGAKKVGPMMRPTIDVLKARAWLLNCLNPEHAQKFDPEDVAWPLRAGCAAGFHDAKHWIDNDTGYQASAPIALEAQLASVVAALQAKSRSLDEANRVVTAIKDNPKLRAVMAAAHIDVEALFQ